MPDSSVYTFTETSSTSYTAKAAVTNTESANGESEAEVDGSTISNVTNYDYILVNNVYNAEPGNLTIVKKTSGADTPEDTVFTVTNSDGTVVETVYYSEFDDDGTYTINSLPVDTYTVTEDTDSAAVSGYSLEVKGNEAEVTVIEDDTVTVTIKNTYTKGGSGGGTSLPEGTSVSVTKVWDDNGYDDVDYPSSITVNLYADGKLAESQTISASDGWTYTFTGLAKYKNGKAITYTVTEDTVDNFTSDITGSASEGYIITNSFTPGKTSVSVTKNWDDADNENGSRPDSVMVALIKNGTATGETIELSEDNNWMASFTDLDEYTDDVKNVYTVMETDTSDGYTATVTGDSLKGYVITNSYTPTVQEPEDNDLDDGDSSGGEDNPKETAITSVPKTGDNSNIILWTVVLAVAAVGMIFAGVYGRKQSGK